MKHFMVCINPECDQPFHEVSARELIAINLAGLPVTVSLDGSEPPLEAAATVLEEFLENTTQDKIKDMAYEKLKATHAILNQEDECMGSAAISPISASDDYYQSAEYKAHRIRMDELELQRVKAETQLVEAKARLTIAEAQKIELNLPTAKRVKPETN